MTKISNPNKIIEQIEKGILDYYDLVTKELEENYNMLKVFKISSQSHINMEDLINTEIN